MRTPRTRARTTGDASWLVTLFGRRILLRPLQSSDFVAWNEVRTTNEAWLTKWEPSRIVGAPDVVTDPDAFAARCSARHRERQLGTGFGFGIFVDGAFAGEINLSAIQRGPFQSAYVGYWIDERHAGHGYVPEALVVLARYAFEELQLHRIQIAIIPRNQASRRVVAKLGVRDEGVAERYLEINGVWEDHVRYAITAEEWDVRGPQWLADWVD
ncbi:MAG: GNAT family protein [Acidimicrobiales bacterium]|nr:GNAT family N-acetyltransferase [Acidimicrobiales bacterium]MCB1258788.1 GNAT family N-acetyltransferase [Acidimicrobiales bacterium]